MSMALIARPASELAAQETTNLARRASEPSATRTGDGTGNDDG